MATDQRASPSPLLLLLLSLLIGTAAALASHRRWPFQRCFSSHQLETKRILPNIFKEKQQKSAEVTGRWRPEEACMTVFEDAPVFHPSEEEFKDTLKYVASIRPQVGSYGIYRIVPPPSWQPSCLLKEKNIWECSKFTTYSQRINELQHLYSERRL
ncbi:hypothetical protein ACSBR1_016330 [Camellia fascicularis]